MDFYENDEINKLISNGIEKIASRNKSIDLRLKNFNVNNFIKLGFDSRRINQETQINPRRNLQYFNRSDEFISQAMSNKLKQLMLLKSILLDLKNKYGKENEWHDSNVRILLSHIEKALRSNIDDGDFSENQPGIASINYLEQLLYIRYRLSLNELNQLNQEDIKSILLSKDEDLLKKNAVNNEKLITTSDVGKMNYDQLLNTLFAGVKASSTNKHVKRIVKIEVEDILVGD